MDFHGAAEAGSERPMYLTLPALGWGIKGEWAELGEERYEGRGVLDCFGHGGYDDFYGDCAA